MYNDISSNELEPRDPTMIGKGTLLKTSVFLNVSPQKTVTNISEQPSQSINCGDQYEALSFVLSHGQQKSLNYLFLSLTDQYSCVWCALSKPAMQCCGLHLSEFMNMMGWIK